jgi:oligoribonuclease (3'-5' exoribonuclease)
VYRDWLKLADEGMSVRSERFWELLVVASRHLTQARQAIREQEEIISQMLDRGADTREAQGLLEKLRASADAMAEHERTIEEQIRAFEQDQSR